jgi:hypothetical protein
VVVAPGDQRGARRRAQRGIGIRKKLNSCAILV